MSWVVTVVVRCCSDSDLRCTFTRISFRTFTRSVPLPFVDLGYGFHLHRIYRTRLSRIILRTALPSYIYGAVPGLPLFIYLYDITATRCCLVLTLLFRYTDLRDPDLPDRYAIYPSCASYTTDRTTRPAHTDTRHPAVLPHVLPFRLPAYIPRYDLVYIPRSTGTTHLSHAHTLHSVPTHLLFPHIRWLFYTPHRITLFLPHTALLRSFLYRYTLPPLPVCAITGPFYRPCTHTHTPPLPQHYTHTPLHTTHCLYVRCWLRLRLFDFDLISHLHVRSGPDARYRSLRLMQFYALRCAVRTAFPTGLVIQLPHLRCVPGLRIPVGRFTTTCCSLPAFDLDTRLRCWRSTFTGVPIHIPCCLRFYTHTTR